MKKKEITATKSKQNWDNHRFTTMTEAQFLRRCARDGLRSMSDCAAIMMAYDIRLKK